MSSLQISPTREEFLARAEDRVIAVHARIVADDQTPVGLYQRLCGDRELTFLLESAEAGAWSRWSFIGVNAASTLYEQDGRTAWLGAVPEGISAEGDPLEIAEQMLATFHTPADPDLPPLTSGLVGYLGYDVVRRLENLPDSTVDDLQLPEMLLMLASDMAVLDHHRGELWLVANAINLDATTDRAGQAYDEAVARLEAMAATLREPHQSMAARRGEPVSRDELAAHLVRQRTSEEFQQMVRDAVEEIRAGEVFQVVPSQRFELPCSADALSVYRELRMTNPSPYLFLLRLPGFAIVSASPEALVTVRDGRATTRPIAGTRPRGATPALDAALERELTDDPKERAEHVMLVDLGRNDLGRVCVPGTVEVTEFMQVHRYSHVMHLEAEVTGELAPGHSSLAALLACFPAGTLSGAPKVRAMEIIDRLEKTRRGVYGGVVGYFDFAGNAEAAIAIRTALVKDGTAYVQAGAGIVADSDPLTEDQECQHKAMAALTAVWRAHHLESL
ncbi:anthranilate synthase component I [Propionibacteriaceae bacterium Y1923]|uniref:anthranilate synthase component I n=1 Tax=Aestuariimicrobium sp. Y1814 TaxID=3418742 RepID=UPI003C1EB9F5